MEKSTQVKLCWFTSIYASVSSQADKSQVCHVAKRWDFNDLVNWARLDIWKQDASNVDLFLP